MTRALIVVDVQNDFCPGGSLAIAGGSDIVEPCNALLRDAERFPIRVLTQDYHPPGHSSFASARGAGELSYAEGAGGMERLWPDHCVEGTPGADFHPMLEAARADLVIRKGRHPIIACIQVGKIARNQRVRRYSPIESYRSTAASAYGPPCAVIRPAAGDSIARLVARTRRGGCRSTRSSSWSMRRCR